MMIPHNQMFQKAQGNRGIKYRSISVPSKERIADGTRKLSYQYLCRLMEAYSYSDDLLRVIKVIYDCAFYSAQVNGFLFRTSPVRS